MLLNHALAKTRIATLCAASLTTACMHVNTQTQPLSSPTPTHKMTTQAVRQPSAPIRRVDFHDFTPPLNSCSQHIELENGSVRFGKQDAIRQGSVGAAYIDYGDVTGDGNEEALVVVAVETGGSAIPHCAYIYTLKSGAPKLLWSTQTGDRAESGLRRLYADRSKLMVALYSPDDSKGACCPTKYGRIAFQWDGHAFQQLGEVELSPLSPDGGANPTMPAYEE
jgi:hypothetical protein